MLGSIIGTIIGIAIGISFHIFPTMYKHYKQKKLEKQINERRLFEIKIEGIVLNYLKQLQNIDGKSDNTEDNKVQKKE